jgi:hypothetical protein
MHDIHVGAATHSQQAVRKKYSRADLGFVSNIPPEDRRIEYRRVAYLPILTPIRVACLPQPHLAQPARLLPRPPPRLPQPHLPQPH